MQTHEELHQALKKVAFLSIPSAARLLGIDHRTLRKAITAGEVPTQKIGSRSLVPTTWLRRHTGADQT